MAHTPRGWTGARTPSAIKRVRQSLRRRAIMQPRRSEVKTLLSKASDASANGNAEEVRAAVSLAVSALDKAAKVGAIHPNAADRRKSRLMLKANAALGGETLAAPAQQARTTGKAAAAKAAKARIAASRATKAKGEQTAAGKARAAIARSTRGDAASGNTPAAAAPAETPTPSAETPAPTTRARRTTTRKSSS